MVQVSSPFDLEFHREVLMPYYRSFLIKDAQEDMLGERLKA